VPDDECWFRILTNTDHVTSSNTVHYQALKKAAFKPSVDKPWSHEFSGRLASLAGCSDGIVESAEQRVAATRQRFSDNGKPVPSKIVFCGLAVAMAAELRDCSTVKTDVVYTPLDDDGAHSDFVTFYTTTDEEVEPARKLLMDTLRVIQPSEVATRLPDCGAAPVSST
jgi:hypothetical protein